jgi:MoxR-like ATPase
MTNENTIEHVRQVVQQIKTELHKIIVGQDEVIDHLLVALLAEGNVLLEGVPGIAKTLMVKALARILGWQFTRIQFTPDLMPADVTGTNVFNLATSTFAFRPGPVFTDLLLADEINRTPPKTQAALLEAMEERQVTIDGAAHPLSPFFMVLATQNPIEYEGTYPLPEAQLDRFMLKIVIGYPSAEEEREIVSRWQAGFDAHRLDEINLNPLNSKDEIVG